MGNKHSNHLATPNVAKAMHLTKQQVIGIHEACQQLARGTRCFSRKHFHAALQHAQVTSLQDRDILTLLCTMWDRTGNGKVPCLEYSLSLVPLCCPNESIEQVLHFCFAMIDKKDAVTSQETILILKSICATASYLGDETLTARQIFKVVDQVFDNMTIVTETTETLAHWLVVQTIGEHPLILSLLNPHYHQKSNNSKTNEGDSSFNSIMNSQYSSSNYQRHHPTISTPGSHRGRSTSKVDARPFVMTRLENCSTTDVSSVMLSPLVHVPIGHDSVTNF